MSQIPHPVGAVQPAETAGEPSKPPAAGVAERTRTTGRADGPGDTAHLSGLARGGVLNLVGALCSQGTLLLITVLIARFLTRQDVGRYALCFAMMSLLGLLSLAGFRAALTRFVAMFVADADAGRIRGTVRLGVWVSLVSSTVLGLLLTMLAGPIATLFRDPGLVTGIQLTGLSIPAMTISDAALAATQGWRTMRPFTLIGRIYEPLVRLGLTVVALLLGWGLTGAFWALLIGAWTAAALSVISLRTFLRRTPPARPTYETRKIFSFSMVSWGSSLATAGLLWADTLILGRLTSTADVGVYTVATRLVTLAVFVMAPINAAFAPQIARLHHLGDHARLGETYAAATAWIMRLSLPAFVMLMVFPGHLLRLFGEGYVIGASVTVALALGQLVNAGTGPCATVLNMSGRVSLNMVNNITVLALNVALNLLLIPRLGIFGAALAWSGSLALVNIARVVQVRLITGHTPFGIATVKEGAAALAGVLGGLLVRWLIPHGMLQLVVGGLAVLALYAVTVIVLGLDDSDKVMIDSVLRRRRSGGRAHGAARA
ncbi:MAG TPA: flippase [Dermatophilaceae bacterium]|nr:flippase [Dermatophilaceae bacterium]